MWRVRAWGRLSIGLVLVTWAGGLLACSQDTFPWRWQDPQRDFLIIGHRGAPNAACENTLASFAEAVRLGANALEFDVSMTQDGHLVLWHDWEPSLVSELRPTGACNLVSPWFPPPVHTVPLATLQQDYGYEQDGQRLPVTTLPEFVARFAHETRLRWFFLDLKVPAAEPELLPRLFQRAADTLQQHGALAKAVFLTPHREVFAVLQDEAQRRQQATGIRIDIAFDIEGPQVIQLSDWPSTVRRNYAAETRFAVWGKPVVTLQSWQNFLRDELQRRDAVNAKRKPPERVRLIVWTVNDTDDLCTLVGLGVDGIITDEPARLRTIVQRWGRSDTCRTS